MVADPQVVAVVAVAEEGKIVRNLMMDEESGNQFNSIIEELKSLCERNISVDSELIKTIDQVLKFEHLISGISAKFANIEASSIDKEIENGLRLIVEFLDIDRSTFFEISGDKEQFISKYSYARGGIKPIKTKIGNKLFPWTFASVKAGKTIFFSSHSELPKEAIYDVKNFLKSNLHAGYMVPIFINSNVKYALAGGIKTKFAKEWPKSLFPRIQILGEMFANTVERNRYEIRLKQSFELNYRYKKELEFENFYLRKKQKNANNFNQVTKDLRYDKSVLWISKGIEHYTENRNLKLNALCKTVGISKTSFYNIYPNSKTSSGFDRYKIDLINFINYKLDIVFNQINDISSRNSVEKMKSLFVEICYQNFIYFKCLALMVIEKEELELIFTGQKNHKKFQKVIFTYLKSITERKKLSVKDKNILKNALINTIYHQSLVALPNEWRNSIIEISEGF